MHVGAVAMDLKLPGCRSLKEKRAVVRPMVDGARRRFGVSAAEVDHHDRWQRTVIGFAVVASTPSHAEELLDRTERFVWSHPEVEVISAVRDWLEVEG